MIQILRGLSSEFTNRILQDGQIGYCTDTGLVYIGDGIHGIQDLKAINDTMPVYKHINHFILSEVPMVKTTTQKIKRNLASHEIDESWDEITKYNTQV